MTSGIIRVQTNRRVSWKRRLFWISLGAVVALLVAALACYHFPQQVLTD